MVAKGTDIPTKEEGKVIWMWKDESSSADKDTDMSEDAVVTPSTARKNVQKVCFLLVAIEARTSHNFVC